MYDITCNFFFFISKKNPHEKKTRTKKKSFISVAAQAQKKFKRGRARDFFYRAAHFNKSSLKIIVKQNVFVIRFALQSVLKIMTNTKNKLVY